MDLEQIQMEKERLLRKYDCRNIKEVITILERQLESKNPQEPISSPARLVPLY